MQRVLESGCSLCELTKKKDAKGEELGTCHDVTWYCSYCAKRRPMVSQPVSTDFRIKMHKQRSKYIYIYITSKSSKHKSVLDRIYITIHKQLVAIAAPQNHGVRVIPHTFYPLFLPARIFPMTVTKIRICSINIFHKCKQLPTTSIINWYLLIEQINDIQYHVTWRDMYSNKTTLRQCHRTEHLSTLLDRTTATTVSTAFCF